MIYPLGYTLFLLSWGSSGMVGETIEWKLVSFISCEEGMIGETLVLYFWSGVEKLVHIIY